MYHFAYGSNMNINELKKYITSYVKIIGVGYLDNYIFRYRKIKGRKLSAKGNIENTNVKEDVKVRLQSFTADSMF